MTTTPKKYFPALDGIRGLAALVVLLLHLFYGTMYGYLTDVPLGDWHGGAYAIGQITRYGWFGVDLFFVLSGFLITRILRTTVRQPGAIRDFFVKRVSRIFPLYYLVLVVVAFTGVSVPFLILSSLFMMNILPFFPPGPSYGIVWSLSVEMQFYLFWPYLVRSSSRRQLTMIALALIVLCPLLREFAILYAPRFPFAWLRFDGMAWGALLALGLETKRDALFLPASLIAMAVGAAIFLTVTAGLSNLGFSHQFALELIGVQIFSFGLVAFGLSPRGETSLFSRRPARFVGDISYGIYLIHPAMMMLWDHFDPEVSGSMIFSKVCVRAAFVAATTFALATISFYRFERPVARRCKITLEHS